MPLGNPLGLPATVLEALETQKVLLFLWKIRLFVIAGFWYFEALDGLLGPILAFLGTFRTQNGSQNAPKTGPKIRQKMVQEMIHFRAPFFQIA